MCDFYPRPPRGGRPGKAHLCCCGSDFYPRPPRGGRQGYHTSEWAKHEFLSTPSARRATYKCRLRDVLVSISIHALREEGDRLRLGCCGSSGAFLSTPSARRATGESCHRGCRRDISIHALREEGDIVQRPRRGNRAISIHALREEGDIDYLRRSPLYTHFYPRPPRGGRRRHSRH